jgi:hypothetical protein
MAHSNFYTKWYILMQKYLQRSLGLTYFVTFLDFIVIISSTGNLKIDLNINNSNASKSSQEIKDVSFIKYVDPLFYFKKIYTCSDNIYFCTVDDAFFYVIFGLLFFLNFGCLYFIYKSNIQNINTSIKSRVIEKIIINYMDVFLNVFGIFIFYMAAMKLGESMYNMWNCPSGGCAVSILHIIVSLSIIIIFSVINVNYFIKFNIFVNTDKFQFSYGSMFSKKYNLYTIIQKVLISLHEAFDCFKILPAMSNYIKVVSLFLVIFSVVYNLVQVTSNKNLFTLNENMNLFRMFLLLFNFFLVIINILTSQNYFLYLYGLLTSIMLAMFLSSVVNKLNRMAIFNSETLVPLFIYFLDLIARSEVRSGFDREYFLYMNYHFQTCPKTREQNMNETMRGLNTNQDSGGSSDDPEPCRLCEERLIIERVNNQSDLGFSFMSTLNKKIKKRIKSQLYNLEYTDEVLVCFKLANIMRKNLGQSDTLKSIYKLKRLMKNLEVGSNLYNAVYCYMFSQCLFENEVEKRYSAVSKYEETLNLFMTSINLLEDLYKKLTKRNVFGVDLDELSGILKKNREKANLNLESINKLMSSINFNESLISVLNIVYKFVFNKYPDTVNNFADFGNIDGKLDEYFSTENHIIIKYNTVTDTITIIQFTGKIKTPGEIQGKKIESMFHPDICMESRALLISQILNLDLKNFTKLDLLIKGEGESIQQLLLKVRHVPSFDFGEIVLMGNFQICKNELVLVEESRHIGEDKRIVLLLSHSMYDHLRLTPYLFNFLKHKNFFFNFGEMFEKFKSPDPKEEMLKINYKSIYDIFQTKLKNYETGDLYKQIDPKSGILNALKLFTLKNHNIFYEDKNARRNLQLPPGERGNYKRYILYSLQSKKDKRNSLREMDDEAFDVDKILYQLNNQPSVKSMDSADSADAGLFGKSNYVKKLTNENKENTQKINSMTKILTVFNGIVIILISVFAIIISIENSNVLNIVTLKSEMSMMEYNFFSSIMFAFLFFNILPYDGGSFSNNINKTLIYSDYYSKLNNLQNRYKSVDQSNLLDYIRKNYNFLVKDSKSEFMTLKTSMYNFDKSSEGYLDYFFISSVNTLKTSKIKFFDFVDILIDNCRAIIENEISTETTTSILIQNKLYLSIFKYDLTAESIKFSNNIRTLSNLEKLTYETMINYISANKNFEIHESLLFDSYKTNMVSLNSLLNLFCWLITGLHLLLIIMCLLTLKIFNTSISLVNVTIGEFLSVENIEVNLDKFRGLKNILEHTRNSSKLLESIYKRPKKKEEKGASEEDLMRKSLEEEEMWLLVKFDKEKMVRPYVKTLIIGYIYFLIFVGIFLLSSLSFNSSLENYSNFYQSTSELSHTLVNNILYTRLLIVTNRTDQMMNLAIQGAQKAGDNITRFFDSTVYSDLPQEGYLRTSIEDVQVLIREHMRMFDYGGLTSYKTIFEQTMTCDYIYSNLNDTLYYETVKANSQYINLPSLMCKSFKYTNTTDLFFESLAEVSYFNRQILNNIEHTNFVYDLLKSIYDSILFFDLTAYVLFVVRPIQEYLKEDIIFAHYWSNSQGLYQVVLAFLLINIFLEICVFYIINSVFNRRILESNERFAEFLSCIN